MIMIDVKNVSVEYQNTAVLDDISFAVGQGDYVGILGPNGSGKTTLIKALLGLMPYQGAITFQGEFLAHFMRDHHIGYLPQKMIFLDQRFPATAQEVVLSGSYCCKRFPKRLNKGDFAAAAAIMELLGIVDLRTRPIGKLSGGQQQRVLLGRALIHSPQILILDEPTVALDPQSRDTFYSVVAKLNAEKKTTVLLVSHDVGCIGQYTTKLLYLDRNIIFYGTGEEFCKSDKMTGYFGSHSQHLICHRH